MSSSFADQLLKAGLVSEEDVTKAEQQKQQKKHKKRPASHKKPGKRPPKKAKPVPKGDGSVANAAASKILNTSQVEADKSKEKKAQQEFAEQRRIMNIKINELIKDQPVEEPQGEHKFSYVYEGKVRGIYVSESQQKRLAAAELAVTVIKAKTKLIPISLVEPLQAIDPKRFIHVVKEEEKSEDDPYAGFEVPDDITW